MSDVGAAARGLWRRPWEWKRRLGGPPSPLPPGRVGAGGDLSKTVKGRKKGEAGKEGMRKEGKDW